MASADAIRALIAGLGAGAQDLAGSMRARSSQRASAEAALRKLAMDEALHNAQIGKLDAETRNLLQPPERQPPQTISPGQGLLQGDGSYKVPVPEAPKLRDEPLVAINRGGKPVLVRRSEAEGQEPYQAPRATAPARLPASAVDNIGELEALAGQGKDVAALLTAAIRNKTNATGRVGGVVPTPGFLKDLFGMGGKEGASARDAIASLFATIAKQRGGSALSASEIALLEQYVPNQNDPEPRALMKANRFVRELQRIKDTKIAAYKRYGYGNDAAPEPASPQASLPHPEY